MTKKKVLIVATVVKTHINTFHLPFMKMLQEEGYEVHVAAKNDFKSKEDFYLPYCDQYYDIPFERNPISKKNLVAYKELKKIIETNNYTFIHCHTPVGGAIARLVAKASRKKTGLRVIYTAHGFHFFKGAPLKNWLLFYPVEKYLAKYTDDLITINNEDYELAKKNFKAKNTHYVPGVGINLNKFQQNHHQIEFPFNKQQDDCVCTCIGELNNNKNQILAIKSIENLVNSQVTNVKLLLVGIGPNESMLKDYVKEHHLQNHVFFLGYRQDVHNILSSSDILLSCSKREGLPVNVMEGMAAGLPCIVTDCRGSKDLIDHESGGYVCNNNHIFMAKFIKKLVVNHELKNCYGKYNYKKIKDCSIDNIINQMKTIYFAKYKIL